ncbi:hypothetical protein D9M71_621920 [compost metagenome]
MTSVIPSWVSEPDQFPIPTLRAGFATGADQGRLVVGLDEVRRRRQRPSCGGIEQFFLGQALNQRFAGLFRGDIGQALFEPL